jgi:hypothetical protein
MRKLPPALAPQRGCWLCTVTACAHCLLASTATDLGFLINSLARFVLVFVCTACGRAIAALHASE